MANHTIESLLIGAWDTMAQTMDKISLCLNMASLSYMERESMDQKKTFAQLKKDCVDAIDDLQLECDHINEERDRIQAENIVRDSMSQVVKDVIDGKYDR